MSPCKFQLKIFDLLLFIVFTSFLFTSNLFSQQGKLVESLDVLGNRRLTDEEILQHIKIRPGEPFNEKQVQDDLQALLKLGLFNTSQTKVTTEVGVRGGVNVFFQIMELPLIVKLKFDGLRYTTKEELLAELREQKAEVTANSPYQPEKLKKAQRVITEYLRGRGFVDARVDVTDEEVSVTTLIVSFVIDELPNNDEENCCEKQNENNRLCNLSG